MLQSVAALHPRRGARAVEWDGLENRCAGNCTVGSNPTPSAKSKTIRKLVGGFFITTMRTLIELKAASVRLHGRTVLANITWSLQDTALWAIRGGNGAGKSSFLKLIAGDLWPTAGERWFSLADQAQTPRQSPIGAREQIALLSPERQDQRLRSNYPLLAWQYLLAGTGLAPLTPDAAAVAAAYDQLAASGLAHLAERDIRSLSRGQLRQLMLAQALLARPKVLLLDEFSASLDQHAQERLLEQLAQIAKHIPMVYTSHRLDQALIGAEVLELEDGKVCENTREVAVQRQAQPIPAPILAPKIPAQAILNPQNKPLVAIENATVYLGLSESYTSLNQSEQQQALTALTPVLLQVDWQLEAGEHWLVLGANGSGKSTLAKLLAGVVKPAYGGHIRRFDLPSNAPIWQIQANIGLVSAEIQVRQRVAATGFTIVASGFGQTVGWTAALSQGQQEKVMQLFETFQLQSLSERNVLHLSQGELKKLLIMRALVHRPRLLVLDEPFDYLDLASRQVLLAFLARLAASGTQLVITAHRPEDVPGFITHQLVLERGRVIAQGRMP
jgi:molybdate transport system ATP-binding protein